MSNELWSFSSESILSGCTWSVPPKEAVFAHVVIKSKKDKWAGLRADDQSLSWQSEDRFQGSFIKKYHTVSGIVWVVDLDVGKAPVHGGQFEQTLYSMARDAVGAIFRETAVFETVFLDFQTAQSEILKGAIAGIEISQYRFRNLWPSRKKTSQKVFMQATKIKTAKTVVQEAVVLGQSVNVARHLVNLPANILNPDSYAEIAKTVFKNTSAKVEYWTSERLKKENMNLHYSVGKGAENKPGLIRIRYTGAGKKPYAAFVGKGVTFDSGGLDIKPASGMRDMKKDMGGSAAVFGFAYWAAMNKVKANLDIYLPVAENAVDAESFRPGDILFARNGKSVEIHNTDAEGRLLLADSLALAAEQKPEFIVNVATLTGAIKVALGETTPGLFCNNDALAKKILAAGKNSGDNCWRMPLDPAQRHKLRSEVADYSNAHEGFGGAVTAALFLEQFVGNIPWAHLDIYAWSSGPSGALSEKGGSGQMVQLLSFLVNG
jgi:leucyl aminopeptidase